MTIGTIIRGLLQLLGVCGMGYALVGYGVQATLGKTWLGVEWLEILGVLGGAVVLFVMGRTKEAYAKIWDWIRSKFGLLVDRPEPVEPVVPVDPKVSALDKAVRVQNDCLKLCVELDELVPHELVHNLVNANHEVVCHLCCGGHPTVKPEGK